MIKTNLMQSCLEWTKIHIYAHIFMVDKSVLSEEIDVNHSNYTFI